MFVLTVDQVNSRGTEDLVPTLNDVSYADRALAGFTRTAGDEAQAVFDQAEPAIRCAMVLALTGSWHCGVGQGEIHGETPKDPREGRGPAFVNARAAVEKAKQENGDIAFVGQIRRSDEVDAALRLVLAIQGKQRRTTREAYEMAASGASQSEIAQRLGITQQAVSHRLSAGLYREIEEFLTCLITGIRDADAAMEEQ